jgi:hypothetical protein
MLGGWRGLLVPGTSGEGYASKQVNGAAKSTPHFGTARPGGGLSVGMLVLALLIRLTLVGSIGYLPRRRHQPRHAWTWTRRRHQSTW